MDPVFIIESFWQKKSNCACVAFIKALLLEERTRKAFRIQRQGINMIITLQDGSALVLTGKETREISRKNALSFRKPRDPLLHHHIKRIKNLAELSFSIMVRNMQIRGYDGKEYTEQEAIAALTKEGVQTSHFHELLGIKRGKAVPITARNLSRLKSQTAALIYNDKHITIGSCGYYEAFGKAVPIEKEIPVLLGELATHWYRLRT